MKKENKYAALGMKALKRASLNAAEEAKRNNQKIPIWSDNKIEYIAPNTITEQGAAEDVFRTDRTKLSEKRH